MTWERWRRERRVVLLKRVMCLWHEMNQRTGVHGAWLYTYTHASGKFYAEKPRSVWRSSIDDRTD